MTLFWLCWLFCYSPSSTQKTHLGPITCGQLKNGSTNATVISAYYSFTVEYSQFITLTTCNSNYDTEISMYSDHISYMVGAGTCDDASITYADSNIMSSSTCTKCSCRKNNGTSSCSERWSNIKLAPNTYYIKITGRNHAAGDYSLLVEKCRNITDDTTTTMLPTTSPKTTTTAPISIEFPGTQIENDKMVILVVVLCSAVICVLLTISYAVHIGLKNNTLRQNVSSYSSEIQNTIHKTSKMSKIKFLAVIGLYVFDIFDYVTSLLVVRQYLSPLQCSVGETSFDLFGFGIALILLTLIGMLFATLDTIFFVSEWFCSCNCFAVHNEIKQNWYHLVLEVILNVFQDLLTSLLTIISAFIVGYATNELKLSIIINGSVSILYAIKNMIGMYGCCSCRSEANKKVDSNTMTAIKEYFIWEPWCCRNIFVFQIIFSVAIMFSLFGLPPLQWAENRILVIDDDEVSNFDGFISYDVIAFDQREVYNSSHTITVFCYDNDVATERMYNYVLPNDGTQIFCYPYARNYAWTLDDSYKFGEQTWCDGKYIDVDACSMLSCIDREIKVCYGQCTLS